MHLVLMVDALQAVLAVAGATLASLFAGFAQVSAPVAVAALWQGAVVVVALVFCLHLAPRISAAHRFAMWATAFAAVAALPFVPMLAHSAAAAQAQASPIDAGAAGTLLHLDSRWELVLAGLWLAASVFRAIDLAFHSLRLRRLWKSATPVEVDAHLRSMLAAAASTSRSARAVEKRPVEICTTRLLDRPSVIGFFAPRILIPDWLFERLTPGELEQVVLHEAEHLRRRDDWTNLLQKLSLVLFPLNPALAWMERRLCREREMACDEAVVRRTQAPRAYATCLTSLAERSLKRRAEALSLGAWQRRPELVRRVHSILWRKRALHPRLARAWVGAVGCGLLLVSVEFARCPQMVAFSASGNPAQVQRPAKAQRVPSLAEPRAVAASGAFSPSRALAHAYASPAPRLNANLAEGSHAVAGVRAISTRAIVDVTNRIAAAGPSVAPSRATTSYRAAAEDRAEGQKPSAIQDPALQEQSLMAGEPGADVPHQVLLKAEAPTAAQASIKQQDQEARYIVLTAWERVQTPFEIGSNGVSEQYTAAGAEPQNGELADSPRSQPSQVTITRLILAIYPAGSRHATGSSHLDLGRAAVPFDGGWLIFQL